MGQGTKSQEWFTAKLLPGSPGLLSGPIYFKLHHMSETRESLNDSSGELWWAGKVTGRESGCYLLSI